MMRTWWTIKTLRRAAAALMVVILVAPGLGAGVQAATSRAAVTQLRFIYPTFHGIPRDLATVQAAVNAYLQPRMNINVTIEPIDLGTFGTKMSLIEASGEEYDVAFAASWINNYDNLAHTGASLPLDTLLKKDAPQLLASMTPGEWDATRVNGQIYGVLNNSYYPTPFGIIVRKDLATKYHLDLSKIKAYADLTPFLAAVKKGEPGITPIDSNVGSSGPWMLNNAYDGLGNESTGVGVMVAAGPPYKVTQFMQAPEFKAAADLGRQWYQAGYAPLSPPPFAVASAELAAGKFAVQFDQCRPGETIGLLRIETGKDWECTAIGTPMLTTANVKANLLYVSKTSTNPVLAIKFIQMLNTDKTLYNMFVYGVEGKHWVWVNKAKGLIGYPPGVTAQTVSYWTATPFVFGNVWNSYYHNASDVGNWDVARAAMARAVQSPLLGFDFDNSKVRTQEAAIVAAVSQCEQTLVQGLVSYDSYAPGCLKKAQAGGLAAYEAAMQTQLDAWLKSRHH
jgi:putative aldouronate transport system substrate-binding protein